MSSSRTTLSRRSNPGRLRSKKEQALTERRAEITLAQHLTAIPAGVRPIVQAARRSIRAASPSATESAYQSRPPRSRSAMWKIARYLSDGKAVVAIGVFPTYATIFFPRGRELTDPEGLLEGSGKDFRFVKLHRPADAARRPVTALIRGAFRLQSRAKRSTGT